MLERRSGSADGVGSSSLGGLIRPVREENEGVVSVLRCGGCGRLVEKLPEGKLRCPYCSYRVLYKVRPEKLVKKVKVV